LKLFEFGWKRRDEDLGERRGGFEIFLVVVIAIILIVRHRRLECKAA
jgi:hypothetical protein